MFSYDLTMSQRSDITGPPWEVSGEEKKLLLLGAHHFNTDDWFEAHEVWEDIWHMASGHRKRFYQGLIQSAVTIVHVQRGNPRGVRSVWQSCQEKFVGLPDVCMAVSNGSLIEKLSRFIAPVLDWPEDRFAPGQPHGQSMPVDWACVPRVEIDESKLLVVG